jgi:general secretion pathway protein I
MLRTNFSADRMKSRGESPAITGFTLLSRRNTGGGHGGSRNLENRLLTLGSRFLPTTGFTLVEVVVALAILGVGLIVIIQLFSGGLRLGSASVEQTKAVRYARMKMEEIALKTAIEEGTEEGKFDETFRWQVDVKKVDLLGIDKSIAFEPPAEFFHVRIDVVWKSGLKERSTFIESYKTVIPRGDEKKS